MQPPTGHYNQWPPSALPFAASIINSAGFSRAQTVRQRASNRPRPHSCFVGQRHAPFRRLDLSLRNRTKHVRVRRSHHVVSRRFKVVDLQQAGADEGRSGLAVSILHGHGAMATVPVYQQGERPRAFQTLVLWHEHKCEMSKHPAVLNLSYRQPIACRDS
ncbi:MAG: hypothetical protein FE78DRAFT_504494 [Acidomyces sp. 'richmondensis']|nr:MAG: hypothetical protein FE78DRAFT_504494 [Acidomyces sp. 'richmondensis']